MFDDFTVVNNYGKFSAQCHVGRSPCIMCVQYIGGCSVHRGVFSTSGDTMSTSGDTMSTSGDVQYIGGCSVHRGDTMSTSGGYHEYIGGIS